LAGVVAQAAKETEIEEQVDQGVAVGDGLTIAQLGPLDAQLDRLGVDAFAGRALAIHRLVLGAVAVKFVTGASAGGSGERGEAALLGRVLVLDGAELASGLGKEQGTGIASAFVRDGTVRFLDESTLPGHGETGRAERTAIGSELLFVFWAVGPGDGGETAGLEEVLIDVRRRVVYRL